MFVSHGKVTWATDAYASEGALRGMTGYVLEVYDDGNAEVEFSDPSTGETIAQVVVTEHDVTVVPES